MKRLLFIFIALFATVSFNTLSAQEPQPIMWSRIFLQVAFNGPKDVGNHYPKAPVSRPVMYAEGHTLYFETAMSDFTICLYDSDGEEVYTCSFTEGTQYVWLPETLAGEYIIEIHPGDSYYYYSEITL